MTFLAWFVAITMTLGILANVAGTKHGADRIAALALQVPMLVFPVLFLIGDR